MMILYKYIKKECAQSLIQNGEFKIGTLYDFRNEEKYGEKVGDKGEGKLTEFDNPPLVDFSKPETVPCYIQKYIKAPYGAHVELTDCIFALDSDSPNYYVYCLSEIRSLDLLKDFNSDTIIIIDPAEKFFDELTICLNRREMIFGNCIISKCEYAERVQKASESKHEPAFLKDPNYSYQKEYRGVWVPTKENIEPFILNCISASKYCSILDLNEIKGSKYEI